MIKHPIITAIEKYKRHLKKQIRIENYFDFKHTDDTKWLRYYKT